MGLDGKRCREYQIEAPYRDWCEIASSIDVQLSSHVVEFELGRSLEPQLSTLPELLIT
jgi:hypothetical protein